MGSKTEYEERRFGKMIHEAKQAAAREQHRKGLIKQDAEIFVAAFEEFIDACISSNEVRSVAREKLISLLTGITK